MLPGRAAGVGKLARTERNLPGRPGSLLYYPLSKPRLFGSWIVSLATGGTDTHKRLMTGSIG